MPRGGRTGRIAKMKRKYGPTKLRQIARALFARHRPDLGKELMRAARSKDSSRKKSK